MLEADNLSLAFPTVDTVFYAVKDVSIAVPPGQFVGLMGPSGSGKSSLLYLLAGLKDPTAGSVQYKGRKIAAMTNAERADLRRQHFGFIFQQHFLIGYLTVLENVLVGCSERTKAHQARAVEFLDYMGLGKHMNKFPHELSGGQRQRIAAVRALVPEPEVIFADEPTASLDSRTGQDLMTALAAYRDRGGSLIVVTHDASMLTHADRVERVKDGELVGETISGQGRVSSL